MIQPGTLLQDRYRVAEQVGKGGMGEVYVATDERFQSKVAIKRTFYDDPEMRRAFEREARLLNRLRHGALPKVSDHFGEGGGQFLVMEFIEGSDLGELLKRRKVPFPLAEVMRWADELLDALDYLHTQEPPVVHRDIKPPNIKLTPRGCVVLLDFGLAKGLPSQTDSGAVSSVFGYSLSFAPLEQMQGSGTDPRSDLYSLAATLYYLLTCVRPPDALTRAAATVKHQPDPLRPAHLVQAQVPAAVGQVLQRALSQNAALRHASAAELRAALRQATGDAAHREARPQADPAHVLAQSRPSPLIPAAAESPARLHRPRRQSHGAFGQQSDASPATEPSRPQGDEAASALDSRPRISDSKTFSARPAPRRPGSNAKVVVGLSVCLVAACTAAGAYLLPRASVPAAATAGAGGAATSPAPASPQTAPEERNAPANLTADAPDTSQAVPGSNEPARPAPATQTPTSNSGTAAEASAASDESVARSTGFVAAPDGAADAAASHAGSQGLVIHNPAPATSAADATRRAEEAGPAPPAYRPEQPNHPPPGSPYPPPPYDQRRPPPPDGRRPPPRHPRPPFR